MENFLSYCGEIFAGLSITEALPQTLFLIAFFGGFAHCAFMCGPFVVLQQMSFMQNTPLDKMSEFKRLQGVLLLPYHLGRITTYTLLAVLLYVAGGALPEFNKNTVGFVLVFAGVLVLFSLFKKSILGAGFGNALGAKLSVITKRFSLKPMGFSGYVYGIVLGFLPCAMVYGALTAVLTLNSVKDVVFSMVMFGLGTIPSLIVVSIVSHMGMEIGQVALKTIGKVGLFVTALWMLVLGVSKFLF